MTAILILIIGVFILAANIYLFIAYLILIIILNIEGEDTVEENFIMTEKEKETLKKTKDFIPKIMHKQLEEAAIDVFLNSRDEKTY